MAPVAVREEEEEEGEEEGAAVVAAAAGREEERAREAAPQRTTQENVFQRLMWSQSGREESALPALLLVSIAKEGAVEWR